MPLDVDITCAEERKSNKLTTQTGIPFSRKLCYAIGGMPYQMTGNARSFFTQIFLLDVVQMRPFDVSAILFLARAWDAISDPLVGYAVSKSSHTRIGKLIPWIVFSMPMGVISYIMLWYTPHDSMSPSFSFSWYLMWFCLFNTFMTFYHVPFSSLNMFLGGNKNDRDSATGYRMGMEMFATLAGATIQGQIVGVYHARRAHACREMNYNETLSGSFSDVVHHNFTSPLTDTLHNTKRAYLIAALVIGAFYFFCCIVLFLGVKEQLAPLSKLESIQMSFMSGLKKIVRHTAYVRLVFGFFFASVAFQMAQGNFALFCTHAAGMGAYFQHLMLILLLAATISVPLWQMLLLRLGKKATIIIGLTSYIPVLIIISFVRESFVIFAFMAVLAGASLASLYLLPWSMLPDVVDDFKVNNPTCMDLEPMFYSCYVFFNKFGGGVSHGVSTLALHFAGYQPGACRHDSRAITALRVLFAPVPICLLLMGLVLFFFYPINEQQRQQVQAILQKVESDNDEDTTEELHL